MGFIKNLFRSHKNIFIIWLLLLFVKILISHAIPLFSDEAYYWVWGQNLRLSYFDHPPFVAWFFKISDLMGSYLLTARWPFILIGQLTLLIWLILFSFEFNSQELTLKYKNWLWLIFVSPLMGIGSILGTPDVPLIFFWSLSLLCLQWLIKTPQKIMPYIALGAVLGLGFCSKYHIVIFVPLIFIYLLLNKNLTSQLRWSFVPITILSGLFFSLPVLWWNATHNFESFLFQINHGITREKFNIEWPLTYIIGQIFILSPFLIFAIYKNLKSNLFSFYSVFGLGPLLFFLLTSLKGHVEANWPIIALPSLLLLAVTPLQKLQKLKIFHGISYSVLSLVILASATRPDLFSSLHEKLEEPHKYRFVFEEIKAYAPIYASKYQMASSFWQFSGKPFYKLPEMSRYDFFDTLLTKDKIKTPFFVLLENGDELPLWVHQANLQIQEVPLAAKNFRLLHLTNQ